MSINRWLAISWRCLLSSLPPIATTPLSVERSADVVVVAEQFTSDVQDFSRQRVQGVGGTL